MLRRLNLKMLRRSFGRISHKIWRLVEVRQLGRTRLHFLLQLQERLTLTVEQLYLEDVVTTDILLSDRSGHGRML